MTRGRQPLQALEEATEIAVNYGMQVFVRPVEDTGCDLTVIRTTGITLVWVMRTKRFFLSPYELEAQKTDCIGMIRKFPRSPEISQEIWLRSQRGSWRFFRVYENSIVEIRNGREMAAAGHHPAAAPVPPAATGQG